MILKFFGMEYKISILNSLETIMNRDAGSFLRLCHFFQSPFTENTSTGPYKDEAEFSAHLLGRNRTDPLSLLTVNVSISLLNFRGLSPGRVFREVEDFDVTKGLDVRNDFGLGIRSRGFTRDIFIQESLNNGFLIINPSHFTGYDGLLERSLGNCTVLPTKGAF